MSEMLESVMVLIAEAAKGANGGGPTGGESEPRFASESASSLPGTLLCAGTQCTVTCVQDPRVFSA